MTRTRTSVALLGLSLVAAIVTLSTAASAQQPSTLDVVKKRGTLIAGTRADLFPLGFMNAQGEFDGFDVEIFKALAQKLGVKLELVKRPRRL